MGTSVAMILCFINTRQKAWLAAIEAPVTLLFQCKHHTHANVLEVNRSRTLQASGDAPQGPTQPTLFDVSDKLFHSELA